MSEGWIGIDLDGTLAHYDKWRGIEHIGVPIPKMVEVVRNCLAGDMTIKIFTARANEKGAISHIHKWLKKHGLPEFEVTATKDFDMIGLYDDRCITVETNTGKVLTQPVNQ